MTGTRRWVLGGTVGVTVALVIAYLTQAFSDMIAHQRWINFIYTAPASANGFFRSYAYDQTAHSFYAIHTAALVLAAGLTASLFVLAPRLVRSSRVWLCLLLLAVLAPLSWLNYAQRDFVLPDGYQAGVDLGIVFLGMFCAYCVASIRDRSSDVRLIESIIFGLVLFGAVVLPIFFVLVWLLWIAGVTNESYVFRHRVEVDHGNGDRSIDYHRSISLSEGNAGSASIGLKCLDEMDLRSRKSPKRQ